MHAGIMAPEKQDASEKVYQSLESINTLSKPPDPEHASREAGARGRRLEEAKSPYCLDTSGQSVHKSNFHRRLGRLGQGHARALQMAAYIQKRDSRRSSKLRTCGALLAFRNYIQSGEFKLSQGMFCSQHLLCPVCAQLRAGRSVTKYFERVQLVVGKSRITHAIATVKDGPSLKERFNHAVSSFNTLLQKARKARSGGRHVTEFSKVRGGVASIEIKRGANSKTWHPHIHAILLQDEKIDMQALWNEWATITGDSTNFKIYATRGDPLAAFCEVFKYAMKFSEMTVSDNWEAFGALSGKRLLRPFGALWGVKVPEELTDEGLKEDLPYIEYWFRYLHSSKSYVPSLSPNQMQPKGQNNVKTA